MSAQSRAGESGQSFVGEQRPTQPLLVVLALLPSLPGWRFLVLQILSLFWIFWHKLGCFSICLLLGEDLIFLDLLSYFHVLFSSQNHITFVLSFCFPPWWGFCFGVFWWGKYLLNSQEGYKIQCTCSICHLIPVLPKIFSEPHTLFWQNRATLQAPWDIVLHSKALSILITDFIDTHSSE